MPALRAMPKPPKNETINNTVALITWCKVHILLHKNAAHDYFGFRRLTVTQTNKDAERLITRMDIRK